MRWGFSGGQAILTFRALAQSHRFDKAWQLLFREYKHDVHLPENIVAFPTHARA
jgi:hypothetical protein